MKLTSCNCCMGLTYREYARVNKNKEIVFCHIKLENDIWVRGCSKQMPMHIGNNIGMKRNEKIG